MEKFNISYPVLSQACEDETVITKNVYWDQLSDELWGFCGPEEENHKCLPDNVIVVGSGEEGYSTMKHAFINNLIASYLRVITINPLHQELPAMVAFLSPTCNRFPSDDVQNQWENLSDLYDKHIYSQFLAPLLVTLQMVMPEGIS